VRLLVVATYRRAEVAVYAFADDIYRHVADAGIGDGRRQRLHQLRPPRRSQPREKVRP
jgi:hypothetical protein